VNRQKKAIVVTDAGISMEDNLKLIAEKGYEYVCVSRSSLKRYGCMEGQSPVCVKDRKKRMIELVAVETGGRSDPEYYLKVSSEGKAWKESSMHVQFAEGFEEGLRIIAKGIAGKHGIKKYDKVNQRIGRLKEKYPSVNRMYRIELEKNEQDICLSLHRERIEEAEVEKQSNQGVYFIRTSLSRRDETFIWKIYNCIRDIESSFCCL
jgi:hypothetical protein